MDLDLSDAHRLVQRTVREIAESEVAPVAGQLDHEKRVTYTDEAQQMVIARALGA